MQHTSIQDTEHGEEKSIWSVCACACFSLFVCVCVCVCVCIYVCVHTHPTVLLAVKDLWGQWVALLWVLLLRNVPVHPLPLVLHAGDVHFLKRDSVCLQEPHDR